MSKGIRASQGSGTKWEAKQSWKGEKGKPGIKERKGQSGQEGREVSHV